MSGRGAVMAEVEFVGGDGIGSIGGFNVSDEEGGINDRDGRIY
jgi:hypothetical protein